MIDVGGGCGGGRGGGHVLDSWRLECRVEKRQIGHLHARSWLLASGVSGSAVGVNNLRPEV